METYMIFEKLRDLRGPKAKVEFAIENFTDREHDIMEVCHNEVVYGISGKGIAKAVGYDPEQHGKYEDIGSFLEKHPIVYDTPIDQFCIKTIVKMLIEHSGNMQIKLLNKSLVLNVSKFYAPWYVRAIQKNMRIGFNLSSYNKVRKAHGKTEIIPFGVQLAGKCPIDELYWMEFPCGADIKYDGERAIPSCDKINGEWKIRILSRGNNNITEQYPEVVKQLLDVCDNLEDNCIGFLLDGEIVSSSFAKLSNRMHREAKNIKEHDSNIKFIAFDLLELVHEIDDKVQISKVRKESQSERRMHLNTFSELTGLNISYQVTCNSKEELLKFYQVQREDDQEGVVAKSFDGVWEPHSRKGWTKLVPVENADLEIVDCDYGNGKYSKQINILFVENRDGTIKSKIAGLKDKDREEINYLHSTNELIGKIVEVKYRELMPPKDGVRSLRFPSFVRMRNDKFEADIELND